MKKVKKVNGNMMGVIGKMGDDNYVVKDTPCLIPKENIKMFNQMRKSTQSAGTFGDFPSPFDVFWKSGSSNNKKKK